MSVVEVANLRKRYADKVAVAEVSFEVEEGEIFGVLGPNGAGKTTTVECVAGLRKPDAGHVSVFRLDPRRDTAELRQIIGVQLQRSELPEKLTVIEALRLYASFYREPTDIEKLIELLGLREKRTTSFKKLSGGQRQRLSIALALVGSPRLAVLDELTTGLDPQARRDTWELIAEVRDRGVSILLVTHYMQEAERLCDRIAVIDSGRVVAIDSPAGLVSRVSTGQRIRFRPSAPVSRELLAELPSVTEVSRQGNLLAVTGTDNALHEVVSTLAREQIVAAELRVETASLDDAFVALTGRPLDD